MNKWKACIQVNGDDYTSFAIHEYEVSDELYGRAKAFVEKNEPLLGTSVEKELEQQAEKSFNIYSVVPEFWDDAPDSDGYEDEEEFNDALSEFERDRDTYYEGFFIYAIWIEDPGDFARFRNELIGTFLGGTLTETSTWRTLELEYEMSDEFNVSCSLDVLVNPEGTIIDVEKAEAEAGVGETIEYSDSDEVLPDYEQILSCIKSGDY